MHFEKTWILKLDACGDIEYNGCLPVALPEIEYKKNEFSVFPNPTSDFLYFDRDLTVLDEIHAFIYDLNGKRTEAAIIDKKIDVSELVNGFYTIEIMLNDKLRRQFFIKN